MNKVLIITYYWPPSGGAGVQRWLKFTKYLPEFGWEPIILTVDPDSAAYPLIDKSLEEDLPPDLKIHKTPARDYFSIYRGKKKALPAAGFANTVDDTFKGKLQRFIRGNFFIPDPRKGWNSYAFKKACWIIETENIKNFISTSPPHSTQLIGLKIKKRFHEINWIADLRDPWTDIYYYDKFYPLFLSRVMDRGFEKKVLKRADRIITVGSSLKDSFSLKVPDIDSKIEVITNGYDDGDFSGLSSSSPDILTISYIGTLSDAYPVKGLLNALKLFKQSGNNFRLKFIGLVSNAQKNLLISDTGISNVEFIPYVNHSTAIRYMLDSTALLLIIPDHQSNKSILTGKLFEYLATGKPVICIGPEDGDASEIIKETGCGNTFSYDDTDKIAEYLTKLISDNPKKEINSSKTYSRRELTRKLIPLLK